MWELPFAVGIKHVNAIVSRLTGKNQLAERINNKMLEELSAWQHEYNKRNGLTGNSNNGKCNP